jgi:hypothetical protein
MPDANGRSKWQMFSAFLHGYSSEFISSEREVGGGSEGRLVILELAYYNNPRHPISLKELRGRLKEFVSVDFFFLSALKVKRVSSGTSRGINREGREGGGTLSWRRDEILLVQTTEKR